MRVAMLGLMALLVAAMPAQAGDSKLPTTEPIRSAMTAIRDLTLTNHTLVTHRRMPPASAKKFRADIKGHVALIRAAETGLDAAAAETIEEIATTIETGADAVAGEGGAKTPIDGILAIDAALQDYALRFEHPGWQPLR
jgi:tripartite-type tricarboxylate transporter receptor subunit TctC